MLTYHHSDMQNFVAFTMYLPKTVPVRAQQNRSEQGGRDQAAADYGAVSLAVSARVCR
jgi:hypothetical protein